MLDRSIADEVEAAIKAGSAEKHLETARRVTDLFLLFADHFGGEQIELFGDVLERLIKTIEIRALADVSARIALAEVSSQIASVKQAPRTVIRRLVSNPGARVSANGYAIVLAQAENDPDLAVETGIRVDLPTELRQQLLREATEAVRTRLLSRAPPHLFEEVRSAIAAASTGADRQMSMRRDFAEARRHIGLLSKAGQLNEAALAGFARQRKYEETVAALAELSKSSIDVIRPLMQSLRDDGVLVPCRVAGLSW